MQPKAHKDCQEYASHRRHIDIILNPKFQHSKNQSLLLYITNIVADFEVPDTRYFIKYQYGIAAISDHYNMPGITEPNTIDHWPLP